MDGGACLLHHAQRRIKAHALNCDRRLRLRSRVEGVTGLYRAQTGAKPLPGIERYAKKRAIRKQ